MRRGEDIVIEINGKLTGSGIDAVAAPCAEPEQAERGELPGHPAVPSGARWTTFLMGDPPRRFLRRSMRLNCAPGARCDYLAGYDMDHTTPERRARFLKAVERKFATW